MNYPYTVQQIGWLSVQVNKNFNSAPLSIGGIAMNTGILAQAPSELTFTLDGTQKYFTTYIGIDDAIYSGLSSAEFLVYGDDNLLYRSQSLSDSDKDIKIHIDIGKIKKLTLVTTQGKTNLNNSDHSVWGQPQIIY